MVRLHVIGWSEAITITLTIIGVVTVRRNNPILPTQFGEANEKLLLAALSIGGGWAIARMAPYTLDNIGIRVYHQKGSRQIRRIEFTYATKTKRKDTQTKATSFIRCTTTTTNHTWNLLVRRFGLFCFAIDRSSPSGLLSNRWMRMRFVQPEQSTKNRNRDRPPCAYHWRTVDVTSNFCHPNRDRLRVLLAITLFCWVPF